MKKVCILYGWAEGTWQAKKMVNRLQDSGYAVVNDQHEADIIVAHSTSCYLLSKRITAHTIMLIGLPYWPGRNLLVCSIKKLIEDYHYTRRSDGFMWWINKSMHGIWYFISTPKMTYDVITKRSPTQLPLAKQGMNIILIRNQADTFCHPHIQEKLPGTAKYDFRTLPRGHDDCWSNPQIYIDILTNLR